MQQPPNDQPPQPSTSYPSHPQWSPQQPSQPLPPPQYTQYPQQPPPGYPPQYPPPPQPYYPPPYQQPPPPQTINRRGCLALGLIALIVLIGVGISNISTVFPSSTASSDTPTAQIQSTSSITIATDTPTDTPVSVPTALTSKGDIDAQLKSDISSLALVGDTISAQYADHAVVLVGLQQQPDHAYLMALVPSECFSVQKTVWQDPLLQNVNWLDYSVFTQDSQGLPVVLGECILHAQKAANIIWSAFDAQSAWNQGIYENMLLK